MNTFDLSSLSACKHDSYILIKDFFYNLCEELQYHEYSRKYLALDMYKSLRGYYSNYNLKNANYYGHYYAQRVRDAVNFVLNSLSPSVLDAGCGVGSESLLFSLLGSNVIGVDLNKERLMVAKARTRYYEDKFGMNLPVKFILKNVLKFYEPEQFDLIWAMESISHIHPIEGFLKVARENLKPEGIVIISDTNNFNPYARFKAWEDHRKGGLYTTVEDPESSELVPYAQERILSILDIKNLLEKNGFKVLWSRCPGYIPRLPLFPSNFMKPLDDVVSGIPIIGSLGVIYVVIGRKIKSLF